MQLEFLLILSVSKTNIIDHHVNQSAAEFLSPVSLFSNCVITCTHYMWGLQMELWFGISSQFFKNSFILIPSSTDGFLKRAWAFFHILYFFFNHV